MTRNLRHLVRRLSLWAVPLALVGFMVAQPTPAQGQAKEPTDGFFVVPHRDGPPAWGLPEYMTTSGLAGLAIFILCKSARRT